MAKCRTIKIRKYQQRYLLITIRANYKAKRTCIKVQALKNTRMQFQKKTLCLFLIKRKNKQKNEIYNSFIFYILLSIVCSYLMNFSFNLENIFLIHILINLIHLNSLMYVLICLYHPFLTCISFFILQFIVYIIDSILLEI